jgi:hypothetical protein
MSVKRLLQICQYLKLSVKAGPYDPRPSDIRENPDTFSSQGHGRAVPCSQSHRLSDFIAIGYSGIPQKFKRQMNVLQPDPFDPKPIQLECRLSLAQKRLDAFGQINCDKGAKSFGHR